MATPKFHLVQIDDGEQYEILKESYFATSLNNIYVPRNHLKDEGFKVLSVVPNNRPTKERQRCEKKSKRLALYHGTSASRVEKILNSGFLVLFSNLFI